MADVDATQAAATRDDQIVVLGIAAIAAAQLLTAAWILIAPHSFFLNIGPFGVYNVHFVRDSGALILGAGLVLVAALKWPALRPGALAANLAIVAVHAVNHWFDIGNAHTGSNAGVMDALALTVLAATIAFVLRASLRPASHK
ncbi:MAG: hypothetical protein JHC87_01050 [Thermoleophilaceae bacterium]|nr:hypothetical protein [Thermoleophilaceae bacterium]